MSGARSEGWAHGAADHLSGRYDDGYARSSPRLREGWIGPNLVLGRTGLLFDRGAKLVLDKPESMIQQVSERVLNLTEDRRRPGDSGCQAAISRRMNSSHSERRQPSPGIGLWRLS